MLAGEAAVFCSQCGAPQLYVSEEATAVVVEDASAGVAVAARPGAVDWSAGIPVAAMAGGVALVLYLGGTWMTLLAVLSMVWVLTAGQFAVDQYRRRRPQAVLNAAVGARIGAAAGVMLAVARTAALSLAQWLQRYPMHKGAEMDAQYMQNVRDIEQMMQKVMGAPIPAEQMRWMLSSEYRAWSALGDLALGGVIVLLVAIAGGALAGFLHKRRRAAV